MKYHVEKSITINAPVNEVKALIADFSKWVNWSPWNVIEPECPVKIKGEAGKPGHSMKWEGEVIGSGLNTLVKTDDTGYHYDLQFIKPFKSQAKTSLLVEEHDTTTKVTWTMDSSMPIFLFFLVTIMKNWIGMDYERGLRMLKEMAEEGSIKAVTKSNGIVDKKGFSYVGIKRTVAVKDMPAEMKKDFERIVNDVIKERGKSAEQWITIYPKVSMRTMQFTYIAAVSDEQLKDVDLGPDYIRGEIPDGRAMEITHDGSYEFLGNAWSMGMMYMRAKKYKGAGKPFEQYWNSPLEVAPDDLKTSIFFPVK